MIGLGQTLLTWIGSLLVYVGVILNSDSRCDAVSVCPAVLVQRQPDHQSSHVMLVLLQLASCLAATLLPHCN